jgi:hypothetical protein
MSAGLALQWTVVGVAVAASGAYVVRRQAPRLCAALRDRAVIWLLRPGRADWLRRIGRALAPPPRVRLSQGGGCGSCDERTDCAAGPRERA